MARFGTRIRSGSGTVHHSPSGVYGYCDDGFYHQPICFDILPDDSIVTGTYYEFPHAANRLLAKFDKTGVLDKSFLNGLPPTANTGVNAVRCDSQGNVYVAPRAFYYNGVSIAGKPIIKLDSDGVMDTGFGALGSYVSYNYDFTIDGEDNLIVCSGYSSTEDEYVVGLKINGSGGIESTFKIAADSMPWFLDQEGFRYPEEFIFRAFPRALCCCIYENGYAFGGYYLLGHKWDIYHFSTLVPWGVLFNSAGTMVRNFTTGMGVGIVIEGFSLSYYGACRERAISNCAAGSTPNSAIFSQPVIGAIERATNGSTVRTFGHGIFGMYFEDISGVPKLWTKNANPQLSIPLTPSGNVGIHNYDDLSSGTFPAAMYSWGLQYSPSWDFGSFRTDIKKHCGNHVLFPCDSLTISSGKTISNMGMARIRMSSVSLNPYVDYRFRLRETP